MISVCKKNYLTFVIAIGIGDRIMDNYYKSKFIWCSINQHLEGWLKNCINCNHENCYRCLISMLDAISGNEAVMWEAEE
ncbi:MAG: hypothetical protein Ta2B_10450 [Termitinemataceae bacterium]|nr:MAG: hypothetical protein Ta2B_10450 [Termitinemataceae bacterium]